MIELNNEEYKKALKYAHEWDGAIASRGDTPFSDARVFLSIAIKLLEEKIANVDSLGDEQILDTNSPDVLYLCDRCIEKCGNDCLEPNYVCSHTSDISHAKNFSKVVTDDEKVIYVERLPDTYSEVQDVNN